MHLLSSTLPLLLALAAFTSASPIQPPPSSDPAQNNTLETRGGGGGGSPALAQFFYDTACTYLSQETEVKPDNRHQSKTIGGPWGSRSARFVSTTGLFSWTVHGGDGQRERAVRPKVGECVSFLSGVYVTGDVRV